MSTARAARGWSTCRTSPTRVRTAVATGSIAMAPETLALALGGKAPKGAVEGVAEIAGVMAAKRTAELIPLCHPLALSGIEVRGHADARRQRADRHRDRPHHRARPGSRWKR